MDFFFGGGGEGGGGGAKGMLAPSRTIGVCGEGGLAPRLPTPVQGIN